nr:hypothetical protein [Candidatus Njordarchaeota archaeon]
MSQTPDPQLREVIYSRIAELDGCYLLVYAGLGEKLSFLSVFLKGLKTKVAGKLLIDLGLRQYVDRFDAKGTALIGSLSEIAEKDSFESLFPKFVRSEIEKLTGAHGGVAHVFIAIDLSSLFIERRKANEQDIYSVHKSILDLVHSLKGVTATLLYDADSLSESLMSKLVDLHGVSGSQLKRLSNPKALKDESKLKADAGYLSPGIVALSGGIMFFDPSSRSAAVLAPNTNAIKEMLPSDPLNSAHRDLAFENNYTAHEGACPYFSSEVRSGCLLDPHVMNAMRLRGRSFIEGHPCITATDHSLLEKKQNKNEDGGGEDISNQCDNGGTGVFTFGISDGVKAGDCTSRFENLLNNKKNKSARESEEIRRANPTIG